MARKSDGARLEIEETLKALADTPKHIARIVKDCNERELSRKPSPDAWSARDIVAHLRACADVWGGSIGRMIAEHHPAIRYVSPRGWIRKTVYLEEGFADSFRQFSEARSGLLELLRGLKATAWSRGATFTGTTSGRDATVLSYAMRIAEHEKIHLDQLRRTLGE